MGYIDLMFVDWIGLFKEELTTMDHLHEPDNNSEHASVTLQESNSEHEAGTISGDEQLTNNHHEERERKWARLYVNMVRDLIPVSIASGALFRDSLPMSRQTSNKDFWLQPSPGESQ